MLYYEPQINWKSEIRDSGKLPKWHGSEKGLNTGENLKMFKKKTSKRLFFVPSRPSSVLLFLLIVLVFNSNTLGQLEDRTFKYATGKDLARLMSATVINKKDTKGIITESSIRLSFKKNPKANLINYDKKTKTLTLDYYPATLDNNFKPLKIKESPYLSVEFKDFKVQMDKEENMSVQEFDAVRMILKFDKDISYSTTMDQNMYTIDIGPGSSMQRTKTALKKRAKIWIPLIAIAAAAGGIVYFVSTREKDKRYVN